ncbi:MAG: M20/M25/M40 family metallo-hydrolase [Candidatus Micrarchaeota archaeon]
MQKIPSLELTKRLVRFKTTKENPVELAKAVNYCAGYLRTPGIAIKRFSKNRKPSLLAYKGSVSKALLMLCHLDVVEAPATDFVPCQRGNWLYGRGAADMKAGCAAAMNAFKRACAEGCENVAIALTSDEELGGFKGAGELAKKISCKFVAAPEPSNEGAVIEEKGVMWVELRAEGKAAHASRPWLGENAIDKLTRAIEQLRKALPKSDYSTKARQWVSTMNVGSISGGDATNKVADHAMARLDFRFANEKDRNNVIKALANSGADYSLLENEPIMTTNSREPLVKLFAETAGKCLGRKISLVKEHGASDVRFFTAKGIPGVVFGPRNRNIHGAGERVFIPDIAKIEALYCEFAKKVSAG